MPVSQLPQAPYRQDRKNIVTPLIGDVLFSEIRDCTRTPLPEYGTAHPNERKWPHHKLVFIKPVDIERNEIFEFFYAADRDNQDLYNFEFSNRTITGVAGRKLRTVERTYVTLRSEYDAEVPAFNTVMPDLPAGQFDAIYYFLEKEQARIPEKELDSLYIVEKRIYVDEALLTKPVSLTTEKGDLTPAKFRYSLPTNTEDVVVAGDVEQPVLTGDQIASTEEQLNSFIKEVKTVTRTAQTDDITFTGARAYVEGTEAATEETLSLTEPTPDSGLLTVESQVTPLGDGRFIKETVSVENWPTLYNAEWDHTIKAQIKTESTYVAPDDTAALTEDYVSYKAINKDRTLIAKELVPSTELDSYLLGLPTRIDLKLPNVLRSVEIVTSTSGGNGSGSGASSSYHSGDQYAISAMLSSDVSSAGGIKADLIVNIEQPWGSDIPAMVYYFYVYAPTGIVDEAAVIAKLNIALSLTGSNTILSWPFFEPVSKTIVVSGSSGESAFKSVSSDEISESKKNFSRSVSQSSSSSNRGQLNNDVVTIPPTLHGDITFTGSSSDTHTLTSSFSNNVVSGIPRYRFSVDFDATADDIITLWPYGHKFYCDRNIVNATIFTALTDGVYARLPFINDTPPTTSDTKVYVGGVGTDVAPLNGDERIKFSDAFTATAGEVITMFPSQQSFRTLYDITDPTNFSTDTSGVVVDELFNSALLTADTNIVVGLTYTFTIPDGTTFTASAGHQIILYGALGTGGSGHSFICEEAVSVTASGAPATVTVKVRKIDTLSILPDTVTDLTVTINGATYIDAAYTSSSYTATNVATVLSANKQTPITTSFLAEEYPVLSTTTTNGTPTALQSMVTPYQLAATNPPDIPRERLYMVQSRVEPYKWNWLKCMAVVVDATQFA